MIYEFQQLHPTPARGKFREAMWEDPAWSAEEKYNGDRRIAQFCLDNVRFTGRRVSVQDGLLVEKTDNLPHMNPAVRYLIGTVLDGEIIHPASGSRNRHVTSIMGSLPARAVALQKEGGWLRYAVFDCLFFRGADVRQQPLDHRRMLAREAVLSWKNAHVFSAPALKDGKEKFLHAVWARGGEGVVLKDDRSVYASHLSWVKVKKELTEDVVITGFDPPKATSEKRSGEVSITKYAAAGLIGAVRFGQWRDGVLAECGACSGMDDATRAMFSSRQQEFIGQAMEIEANEREPSGKFQHPRYVRLRPDKNPEECVWR